MAMTCYGCLGYLIWLSKELHGNEKKVIKIIINKTQYGAGWWQLAKEKKEKEALIQLAMDDDV